MEQKEDYITGEMVEVSPDMIITKTYTVMLKHVGMLSALARKFEMKDSAVVRMAIEELYNRTI